MYEDMALKRINHSEFSRLKIDFSNERDEISKKISDVDYEIFKIKEVRENVLQFVKLVKKIQQVKQLEFLQLREIVDKIVIYERDSTMTMKIKIYYKYVGQVDYDHKKPRLEHSSCKLRAQLFFQVADKEE
jgi:hypothetical protein